MQAYILRRIALLIPVLLGVSILVFLLIRLVPGDVVLLKLAEMGRVDVSQIETLRRQLGLDRPVYEQYWVWIWNVLRGDLGTSLWTGQPVIEMILARLPLTMELALLTIIISVCLAIPIGIISAARQDTWADYFLRVASILGLSFPNFFVATILILLLSAYLKWMPPVSYTSFWEDPWRNFQQMIFPALTLGVYFSASVMRMARSSLLEVLRQDYIKTAWAKGLSEKAVLLGHAMKNATIPVLTLIGNQFGFLLGGQVIIEEIFSLPGFGRLTLQAIFSRDYPVLQGCILVIAASYVLVNLIVDIAYAWFDPRIRYA